jgi:hypothetical protein
MSDILRRLMTETWPAKAAKSALEALMLPGQVAGGQLATQPSQAGMWSDVDEARSQATQQGIGNRAVDLAGLLMGGTYGAAPAGAVGMSGAKMPAEKIAGAAFKYGDEVFQGMNHGDAYEAAVKKLGFDPFAAGTGSAGANTAERRGLNGFLTSTGRFVSREEALRIAEAANQAKSSGRGLMAHELKP